MTSSVSSLSSERVVRRQAGVPMIVATGIRTPIPPSMTARLPESSLAFTPVTQLFVRVALLLGAVMLAAYVYYR